MSTSSLRKRGARLARQVLLCRLRYSSQSFNKPKSGIELVRVGGLASLFRLPTQEASPEGLDACFVGVPFDAGSDYRPGARLGPRAIRSESRLIRYQNPTGALPFASLQVADIGDVPVIPQSMERSMLAITDYYHRIVQADCVPLTMGGDHSITYPILRALSKTHGPVALVQVDSHPDLCNTVCGEQYSSGTVMRRAVEDGLVDAGNMIQIGLRGSVESRDVEMQFDWARKQGIRQVLASQCWHKSLSPLMEKIRSQLGNRPTYFSLDVSSMEPTSCPGPGTPEVGGLTPIQVMEIVQGLRGINLVGVDLTEVNPMSEGSKITSLMAANLMFELLCVLPGVKYEDVSKILQTDLI